MSDELTPEVVLLHLEAAMLTVEVRGKSLVVTPSYRISPILRQWIRDHRDGLVALLKGKEEAERAERLAEEERRETERLARAAHKLWSGRTQLELAGGRSPVDPELAAWFAGRRSSKTLPAGPFELAPSVTAADPERLYLWIEAVLARGDTDQNAREAERHIRQIMQHCGGNEDGEAQ